MPDAESKNVNARTIVLIAFGFSGAAALIYEVAWTRALSLILGSTTYAISTMLATFMGGLALGGFFGGRIADRQKNLLMLFGLLELGIGIFGLITIHLINSMPPLYFKIYKAFHLSPATYFVFQFLLCAGIMLIPTTLMGATFPVVSKKVTLSMDELGKWVGEAYSFNTFGAILGSLAAGFLLIPFVGVKLAAVSAAVLNIVVASAMIVLSRARIKGVVIALAIAAISAPLVVAIVSEEEAWPATYYVAGKFEQYGDVARDRASVTVLFDRDFREGRVKLWRDGDGFLILQTGGKIEGTSEWDLASTSLLAYLPIASHPNAKSFLTIGLGAGVTLEAAKEHMRDVSLVEINSGVIEAIDKYGPPGLLEGVDVTVQDARNYLFLTDRKFDIISSEPSYPTEASTANLFTREFFELAASRLNERGVFCQWLPYHALSNDDVTMMLKTFGSVFDHVYLWKVQHSLDLMIVGSNTAFAIEPDEIKERVFKLNTDGVFLPFVLSRTPEQVRDIVKGETNIPLNTDDKPILEFHAARNFITGVKD